PRDDRLIVAVRADQARLPEADLQGADEFVRVVPEQDGGHAVPAGSDKDCAKRALPDGEPDLLIDSPRPVLRGSHAEHAGRLFVEASARTEPGLVDGFGYGRSCSKALAHLLGAVRGGIALRRQTGCGLEHAVEIAGAETDGFGDHLQRGLLLAALDEAASLG